MLTKEKDICARAGRVSYGIIAWLLGAPGIVILIALMWGGCTNW